MKVYTENILDEFQFCGVLANNRSVFQVFVFGIQLVSFRLTWVIILKIVVYSWRET